MVSSAILQPGDTSMLGAANATENSAALLYAVIVTMTFLLGLSFEGRLYSPEPGQPLTILATFAVYGAGLLNLARADHRSEHLDDIERVLGKKSP